MSIITVLVLLVSVALNVLLGVNNAITTDNCKTLTVTVDDYYFNNELEKVQDVCENVFAEKGVDYEYCYQGAMSGDSELVYVFEENVELKDVKAALEQAVVTATADNGALDGAFIYVTSGSEALTQSIPASYTWRAVGAVALFTVLAFLYTAIRYGINGGVLTAIATAVSAALATALVLLVRIPVTTSIFYVAATSAMLGVVFTLFTLNKVRANLKSEEWQEKTAEETVGGSIAKKEILATVVTLGVALVLVGAIATASVRWFAITALVGLAATTFVGLCFVPALYTALYNKALTRAAGKTASGYVGAKKAEKQEPQTTEQE